MTAAEELSAAVDHLDALVAEATPGPWAGDGVGRSIKAPSRMVVMSVGGLGSWPSAGDFAYIIATNPDVGRALVALLRFEATCCRNCDAMTGETAGWKPHVLGLARAILSASEAGHG